MACVVPPGEAWSWFADKQATIYGTPITLSALAFNILMGIAGGIIGSWIWTKDPFWMMSGALAGIISVASGLDIYFPALAFIIAMSAGMILKPAATWLESRGIDDAVGAVTVHGTIGLYGVIMLGVFGSGYLALAIENGACHHPLWSNYRCGRFLPSWFCTWMGMCSYFEENGYAAGPCSGRRSWS